MSLGSIVIGSCVESALYAFINDCIFIPSCKEVYVPPFYMNCEINFLGNPRKDYIWSRLNLFLSMQGRLLNYRELESVRVLDKKIKIITAGRKYEYCYDKCFIFDTTGIKLHPDVKLKKDLDPIYIVYDDFELSNLGGKHLELVPKISEDYIAGKIHYYCSDRVDGANYITDCIAESLLTKKQLMDFEYSDTMVRFAVERHLDSIDIKGNKVGTYKNGKSKFRKPKVKHNRRVVQEKDRNIYENTENIFFMRGLRVQEIIL